MDDLLDQKAIVSRLIAVTWLFAPVLPSCAGARLDPEKNQALTFDTSGPSDAGVEPALTPMSRKATPSQLASSSAEPPAEATSKSATAGAEPIRCTQDPPDPKPTSTRDWVAFEFKFVNGRAQLQSARRVQTQKPRDAARVVGRYAIELWIGCELIERVRFSFPLQAAEGPMNTGPRHALHEQPSLTANAELNTTVLIPLSDRATRAELVDRNIGTREMLAWPPNLDASVAPTKKKTANKPGDAGL